MNKQIKQEPVPEIKFPMLQEKDLKALIRFNETCEDEGTYDIERVYVERLIEIGALRRVDDDLLEITSVGKIFIDINRQSSLPYFLMTCGDYNE